MKKHFTIILFLLSLVANANMASPYRMGSKVIEPFVSKNIDILHETIHVSFDSIFSKANFNIEYQVFSNESGVQIPFLFLADGYLEGFKIWLDGELIIVKELSENGNDSEYLSLLNISSLYDRADSYDKFGEIIYTDFDFSREDLVYFEVDLPKGDHTFRIEYVAKSSANLSKWVKELSFNYILSPAQHWKSFSELDVVIDASNLSGDFGTNLDEELVQLKDQVYTCHFVGLPNHEIKMTFNPEVGLLVKILMQIFPIGLGVIFWLCSSFILLRFLKKRISKKRLKFIPIMVIVSSFVLPIISVFIVLLSIDLITFLLKPFAGRPYGYFIFIFSPFITIIIQWGFTWLFVSYKMKQSGLSVNTD